MMAEVGTEVGYPPRERKLWIPSMAMKGGEGREAMDRIEMMRDQFYFSCMI